MKVRLLYRDRDLDLDALRPPNADALIEDLELHVLFSAMAAGDRYLFDIAARTVLVGLDDPEAIRYRQAVLADCLASPITVRTMYDIAVEAIEVERKLWGAASGRPETVLHRSAEVLHLFVASLRRLRHIAETSRPAFRSEGFANLFETLTVELHDAYLRVVEAQLKDLGSGVGVSMSAQLGPGNRTTSLILRKRRHEGWLERVRVWERTGYSFEVAAQDQAGMEALSELHGRGVALAAGALGQSSEHILDFFRALRAELGFFLGCVNLRDGLQRRGTATCLPEPAPRGVPVLVGRQVRDPCLILSTTEPVIGSDIDAHGRTLVMMTGANRGGKSTFLRALGLAQLMMQAGMFVAAEAFTTDVREGIFTHFRREEDRALRSGKLDEELVRMSAIVDDVTPGGLVLFNESFASTNEREGSEIARQIVHALLETGVRVHYVTHMFDLAQGFQTERASDTLFLRAERLDDGRRTFRLIEGEPLPTSFGEDVYRRVFGEDPEAAAATPMAGAGPARRST